MAKAKKKAPLRVRKAPAKRRKPEPEPRPPVKPRGERWPAQGLPRPIVDNPNKRPQFEGPWVVDRKNVSGLTCQRQFVKCGKKKCRCMRGGAPHGPYWYAYKTNRAGRQISRYVGIELKREKVAAWAGRSGR